MTRLTKPPLILPGYDVAKDDCPNRDAHTNGPDGYLQWHSWADRMKRNHSQKRCPKCGFYVIVMNCPCRLVKAAA